jgi:hypothetical protein
MGGWGRANGREKVALLERSSVFGGGAGAGRPAVRSPVSPPRRKSGFFAETAESMSKRASMFSGGVENPESRRRRRTGGLLSGLVVAALGQTGCRARSSAQEHEPPAAKAERASEAREQPAAARRLYARALRTWVHAEPSRGAQKLGYLRAGSSVVTSGAPRSGDGCAGGWYPIEPSGFVCVGSQATLDENDSAVRAMAGLAADTKRRLPYIYGTVRRPGPVFGRLPSPEELSKVEPDLEERMQAWLSAEGEIGAGYAQHVWLGGPGEPTDPALLWRERKSEDVPEFLQGGARPPPLSDDKVVQDLVVAWMKPRVGYSLLRTFVHQGRRYGLTSDFTLVPTDRLRPIQGSDFRGVEIGKDVNFPFAFVRKVNARFMALDVKELVDAGAAAYRSVVKLTGKQQFFRGRLHYETQDGKYVSDLDASRLDPARRMPAWGKNGEKWLDVNITKQTLVAYDGTKPVYATLISSGEAGLEDHSRSTATKRGIFRIHTKHLSSTMSSSEVGEEFELRDVPYVQYFEEGYALHGAYWHDRFGTPKSHGCLNVSPEDARWLFSFTEPSLPPGWHAVLLPLKGTVIFVHP